MYRTSPIRTRELHSSSVPFSEYAGPLPRMSNLPLPFLPLSAHRCRVQPPQEHSDVVGGCIVFRSTEPVASRPRNLLAAPYPRDPLSVHGLTEGQFGRARIAVFNHADPLCGRPMNSLACT